MLLWRDALVGIIIKKVIFWWEGYFGEIKRFLFFLVMASQETALESGIGPFAAIRRTV